MSQDTADKIYLKDFERFLETVYAAWQTVDLSNLEKQKKEIDKQRPFPSQALKSLEGKLEVDEVHNSTAIEGNSLTLGETELVLNKGLTVAGKPLKDHLEVKSYDQAYHYIKSISREIEDISEDIILEIHKLVFADFTEKLRKQLNHGIGVYRRQAVFIRGSSFVPPNWRKVPELMEFLLDYINNIKGDPVRKAALAHLGLVSIHPFIDGNGRAGRLLTNLILLKEAYPIAVINQAKRSDYLNSLEVTQKNSQEKIFLKFIVNCLQETFDLYQELYG